MTSPTRIVTAIDAPASQEDGPLWHAFGDPDDHLRLVALIADFARTHAAKKASDAAEICLSPSSTWRARLDAFQSLLGRWQDLAAGQRCAVFDVDALDPGPVRVEAMWDDRSFLRQRRETIDAILEAASCGGWLLVRPHPTHELTLRLADVGQADEIDATPSGDPRSEALLDMVAPDARPLLAGLLRREVLKARDLERLFEAADPREVEEDLVHIVYESLPPSAQHAAKLASAPRGPQDLNGSFGSFTLSERPSEVRAPGALAKASIAVLEEAGVLQRFSAHALRMPRIVRDHLSLLAARAIPDEMSALHRDWGRTQGGAPLASQLERHYHAVQGGDVGAAIATAKHYVTDLRDMAYRRSRAADYHGAAEIYEKILELDPDDAYAWEYLAYNRARAWGDSEPDPDEAGLVLDAYRRAFDLDRNNPLYHGRLLGFRAALGEDVEAEFHRGMRRYLREYEGTEAVSYFAEQVLSGMKRGSWGRRRHEVVERWRPVLGRFSRLHPLLGIGDGG